MSGQQLTASAVISFAERLEDASSAFYEALGARFSRNREAFAGFAGQGKKNKLLVTRTYQETITDALEACFAFEGLDLAEYEVTSVLPEDASYPEGLEAAIALEEKAIGFYQEVAERSGALLATIPRAFRRVARVRSKRVLELESFHGEAVNGG